jgi:L-fuconolactonase
MEVPADKNVDCLRWDLSPKDQRSFLAPNDIEGCVAIQTKPSEKETDYLIAFAKQWRFIKGVVGWIDLEANDIRERLEWYRSFPILKGFRHMLQKSGGDLMARTAFQRGIAALQRYRFTYDLFIFPDQLKAATQLTATFPGQKFVVDLSTGSNPGKRQIAAWRTDIRELASNPDVYCKIPGMITGRCGAVPVLQDLKWYLDGIVEAFGMDRVMYGSDLPLSRRPSSPAARNSEQMSRLITEYFSNFSKEERELFFIWNAVNFYNL